MKRYLLFSLLLLSGFYTWAQAEPIKLSTFTELRIGQHIKTELVEGKENKLEILYSQQPAEKLELQYTNNRLDVYLEGARFITKHTKEKEDGYKTKEPIYKGTEISIRITYKKLNKLSLMGEEETTFLSDILVRNFGLHLYGAGVVSFKGMEASEFVMKMYGEYEVLFEKGQIGVAKYTIYGASDLDFLNLSIDQMKATIYGEAVMKVHVKDSLKVSGFGEYLILYKGNPDIVKQGITLGEGRLEPL